jgi:transcriptional regulator with XRE-family HTH domain
MRGTRLKDVALAAGCSESLVSKIENNKLQPSLQVLHNLCSALKIGLGELFNPQQDDSPVVTRATKRTIIEMDTLRRGKGIVMERVIPYAKGHLLQSNIHIVAPGGASFGLISHEGEEVGYIISGEIELFAGDKSYRLAAGDTFCFRSEIDHGYRNRGTQEARILFVNTPPTF